MPARSHRGALSKAFHSEQCAFLFQGVTLTLNAFQLTIRISIVLLLIFACIYHRSASVLRSLQDLVPTYGMIGIYVVSCVVSIVCKAFGIIGVQRKAHTITSLLSFVLAFQMLVEAGVLYTFVSLWTRFLAEGTAFAVQSFRPGVDRDTTMAAFQLNLHCCGAMRPSDYGIANIAIPDKHVPISCCDMQRLGSRFCANASSSLSAERIIKDQKQSDADRLPRLIIPVEHAFASGCIDRLIGLIFPCITGAIASVLLLDLVLFLVSPIYVFLQEDLATRKLIDRKIVSKISETNENESCLE